MASQTEESKSISFKILPATLDDADALQQVTQKSMGSSFQHRMVWPAEKAHLTDPEELRAWRVRRLKKAMSGNDVFYYKAVPTDESDHVVGFISWFAPGHFKGVTLSKTFGRPMIGESAEGKSQKNEDSTSSDAKDHPSTPSDAGEGFPACMNAEAFKEFLGVIDKKRKEIWGDESNFWWVGALSVIPEYQRRGIATQLLKVGLDWADRDGLPTYLEATPDGALLYPKVGFKKVDEMALFDGQYVAELHIRPPQ